MRRGAAAREPHAPPHAQKNRLDIALVGRYLTERLLNQTVNNAMSLDRLSTTLSALADPTRRAILARLTLGETSVSVLAEPFAMSLPAVSKHLKVLERAGLIARSREAQWRPCRLETATLKEVDDWLESYRRFWEQSFDRLEHYLLELKANEKKSGRKAKAKRRARR
jgi:DNA-binding transcriptional ArsR family regulator